MSAASLSMNSPVISISFSRMDEVKRKIVRAQEEARCEAESLSRAISSLQVSDGRLRMKVEALNSLRSRIIKRRSGLQAMGAHIDYAARRFREVDELCAQRINSNGYESGKLQELTIQSRIYGNIAGGLNSVVDQGIAAWDYVKTNGNMILDCIQTGLDIVGLIPGFGEIADGINAGIYLLRGDYGSAALSLAAMIPVLGCAATAGKFINKGVKAYKQSKNIANAFDTARDIYGIVKKTGNKGIQKVADIVSDLIGDARRAFGKSPVLAAEGVGTLRGSLSDFGKVGIRKVEETPVQKGFKEAYGESAAGANTAGDAVEGTLKTLPQGLTSEQFGNASKLIRQNVGNISDDIVVQGSRAGGTAKAASDIDFVIRVSSGEFDTLIKQRFGTPNVGSAKERTMLNAIETGKIQSGEAGLRSLRKQLQEALGMDVDISIIKSGGPFDNGATINLPK